MVTFVPRFVTPAVREWTLEAEAAAAEAGIDPKDLALLEPFIARRETEHPPPSSTLADVVAHVEHVREVAGVDHVGLGGDYDGVGWLPEGLEDVTGYPRLLAALADRHWSADDLAKLTCRNVLRTLRTVEDVAESRQAQGATPTDVDMVVLAPHLVGLPVHRASTRRRDAGEGRRPQGSQEPRVPRGHHADRRARADQPRPRGLHPEGCGSRVLHQRRRVRRRGRHDRPDAEAAWGTDGGIDMVLKVKEPIAEEYPRMREGLTLFTYLHLAADKPLTEELINRKVTGIAYETVQLPSGGLPLLYPMSEVAGCLAPQVGAYSLMKAQGGRGVLMGGVGGVANAKVVIIGAGVSGQNAANIALGMGADVTLLDTDLDKLRMSFWRYNNRVHGLASSRLAIQQQVMEADMVIGAVLIPGAAAPKLVSNDLVSRMKPGSVLVDIAVDQGGCFEDTHATTHADPTYPVHNSIFYCVANMPGAVPNTSTYALTNATHAVRRRAGRQGLAAGAAATTTASRWASTPTTAS